MPKGKKKFIDRKNAVTFHLVHRSQQDPLIADETAPKHVLVPAAEEKLEVSGKRRREEQRKYGIFFDDEYNYLQHLRDVGEIGVDWEAAPKHQTIRTGQDDTLSKETKINLPSSVFASEVEENVGLLNRAAPRSGLRLDLDPDIVAALDEDFDFEDPKNILEDNFIELANKPVDSEDDYSDISSGAETGDEGGDEADYDEDDDEIKSLNGSQFSFTQEETKSRFTNYSMTSSVIRRNEQLSLLDLRFEKLYEDYDDNEIGALDCEEIEGTVAPDSELIMQFANQFETNKSLKLQEADKTFALVDNLYTDSENSEIEVMEVPYKETDKWDCESILSTYSNLYNHPKLITEQPLGCIKVSGRSGIPLDVLDSNKLTAKALEKLDSSNGDEKKTGREESVISMISALSIRPKNETRDEKKDRKKAIKLYRKERRFERKANAQAFKEEKKRQEKVLLNAKVNQQGVKII